MSRLRPVFASALGLCAVFALTAESVAGVFNGLFIHNEMRPVYAPAETPAADPAYGETGYAVDDAIYGVSPTSYGVTPTSHECLGGWTEPSSCHACDQCSTCDGCSGCRSHWSLWWEHVKCRFKRCRWEEGFDTCYPVCPPVCGPQYGYHPTCWRRLAIHDPCPPAVQNVIVAPEPGLPETPQLPAYPPPAPSDMIAPPAPPDALP